MTDYKSLGQHLDIETLGELVNYLIELDAPQANLLGMTWKNELVDQYAPATVNRRLCSLRELVRVLRQMGFVSYHIEVKGVKTRHRDMSGPKLPILQAMINYAHELGTHENERKRNKGLQLVAIMRLLFDLGLRASEVSRVDVGDIEGDQIQAMQKGFTEKSPLSIPKETQEALQSWQEVREGLSADDEALFINHSGGRLSGQFIYNWIRWLGKTAAEAKAWPHGIRHTSITCAVEKAQQHQLDLTHIQQFSRHQKLDTLMVYRDKVENVQGRVASIVARQLE